MEETLNYIKVLNWGYEGFAPMTLNTDFEKSLQQVQERLGLLDSLNYEALFVEATSANGKANLQKYQSTDDTIEYSLHFIRDGKGLLEMLKPDCWEKMEDGKPIIVKNPKRLLRAFFDGADKLKADGLWTDEQWREYRVTLSQIEKGLEDRLKQFAAAYELTPTRAHSPKNIRGGGRKSLKDKPKPTEKHVTESDIIGEPLCYGAGVMGKVWLTHLKNKKAVWQSVDRRTFRKALLCGDIATISTGINKNILVGFFKVFAKGYAPNFRSYAVTDEEKETYKRVCMESAGFTDEQWQKAGVGKMTKEQKKALFNE